MFYQIIAFLSIADFDLANLLSQNIDINKLHEKLDTFAQTYCPALNTLDVSYHWSIMQIEYATWDSEINLSFNKGPGSAKGLYI